MRVSCWALAGCATALLSFSPRSSTAHQLNNVALEKMAPDSDVIVHARVTRQRVTWSESHARILTLTEILVIEGIKGATAGESLTIYQVGGTLDGLTMRVPGAPRFEPGEEVLFFGKRLRDMVVVYTLGAGAYRVARDETGRPVLLGSRAGSLAGVPAGAARDSAHRSVLLTVVIERVREVLAQTGSGGQLP